MPASIRPAASAGRPARAERPVTASPSAARSTTSRRPTARCSASERPGIENLPEILKVDGFDGCFLGAGDLALTMGRQYFGGPGTHPEVQALVDRALNQILQAGKLVMLPTPNGDEARALAERGVQLITLNFGAIVRKGIEGYLGAARGGSA